MSRTRLIVSTIFIVLIVMFAASAWAGGLKPATPPTVTPAAAISSNPQGVMLMDVDGDGILDLVVVEPDGGPACAPGKASQLEIFLGNGDGTFTLGHTTITIACEGGGSNQSPTSISLTHGQLTGGPAHPDDIVIGNSATGDIVLLANTSNKLTHTINLAPTANSPFAIANKAVPAGLAVANVDGNATNDFIVADQFNDAIVIFSGNGLVPGSYNANKTTISLVAGAAPASVAIGNFGSAHSGAVSTNDIAVAQSGAANVRVLVNNSTVPGTPSFAAAVTTYGVGTTPIAIAAAPLGSGALDLVVANNGSTNVSVLLNKNNASGTFNTAVNYPVGSTPTGVVVADFNNDPGNPGVGNFGAATHYGTFTTPAGIAIGVAPNDINNPTDNYSDVAVADTGATKVAILLGTPFAAITAVPVAPNPKEGIAFGPSSLLQFKYDGDPAAGNFTANITTWGDAGCLPQPACDQSAGTVSGDAVIPGQTYTVDGSHLYSDPGAEGAKVINLTMTNTVAPNHTITGSSSATVVDAPLHPLLTNDLPSLGSAPQTYGAASVVANFSDDNTTAPASTPGPTDYTAQIDFDDCGAGGAPHGGAPGTCAPGNLIAGTITGNKGGPFAVSIGGAGYTFAKNGLFTIVTTITDVGGSNTSVTTHANLASLTFSPGANFAATEGAAVTPAPNMGTFQSATLDATNKFSASIDWGDCGAGGTPHGGAPGTCAPANLVAGTINDGGVGNCQGPGNTCSVSGTYTYKFGSLAGVVYPVVVKVTDTLDGSFGSGGMNATVADATLSAATPQPATIVLVEGGTPAGPNALVAHFVDNNPLAVAGDFSATVNWNDSNGNNGIVGTVTGGPTTFNITAPVAGVMYAEEGPYQVTFSVTDIGGGAGGQTLVGQNGVAVTVNDAPLINPTTVVIDNAGAALLVGVDSFTGSLGGFTDTAGPVSHLADFDNPSFGGVLNVAGSYVDWGDGTKENCSSNASAPPAGTPNCVISGAAGTFSVTGTHTFQKAGPALPVVVHIIDKGGQTVNINDTANVTSIFNTAGAAAAIVPPLGEGNTTGLVQIATFSSARNIPGIPVPADFNNSAVSPAPPNLSQTYVDWGDGVKEPCSDNPVNTPNCRITAGAAPPPPAGATANFVISGAHIYAEGGVDGALPPQTACVVNGAAPAAHADCTITVHIVDNVDTSSATPAPTSTAQIFDAALSQVGSGPLAQVEGKALTNVIVGTFHDDNPNSTTADFPAVSVLIDWDDCAPNHKPGSCGLVDTGTVAGAAGSFTVLGTHTYLEAGTFNIQFAVADVGGVCLGPATPACALNAPAAGATATISDAPLTPTGAALTPNEGTVLSGTAVGTFTDGNTLAPLTDYSITINWGDASPNDSCVQPNCALPGNVTVSGGGGSYTVNGTHTYANAEENAPLYNVTITVNDVDGQSTVINSSVKFVDAPLVADPTPIAFGGQEGTAVVNQPVGIFYDEFPNAPAGDYTILINWGDGSLPTPPSALDDLGTVPSDPLGNPAHKWRVRGTHLYTEGGLDLNFGGTCVAGVCQVQVQVNDVGGQSVTINPLLNSKVVGTIIDAPIAGDPPITINGGTVNLAPGFTGTVATWTDGNPLATDLSDYPTSSVNIQFNDGAALMACSLDSNIPEAPPTPAAETCLYFLDATNGNAKTVVANHIFLKAPSTGFAVVSINDKGGASTTVSDPVVVTSIISVAGAPAPIPSNEGNSTGMTQIASFSSTRSTPGTPVPADFNNSSLPPGAPNLTTTFVDWGDGVKEACSSNAAKTPNCVIALAAVPPPPPAGATANFVITGAHIYAEGGLDGGLGAQSACVVNGGGPSAFADCTITVHIVDNVDSSIGVPDAISHTQIFDAPLNWVASGPLNGVEGLPLNAGNPVIAGTFHDANPSSTTADYPANSALIDWDDCGPNHSPGSCGLVDTGTVTGAAGNFTVMGTHTYLEPSAVPFQIQFAVVDVGGACLGPAAPPCGPLVAVAGAAVTIIDGTLTQVPTPNFGGTEGNALGGPLNLPVVVGTFDDQNPQAPVTDFVATIDWHDCGPLGTPGACLAPVPGTISFVGLVGGKARFNVLGPHTYGEPGVFNTAFTVTDVDGSVLNPTPGAGAVITIGDAALGMGTPVALNGSQGQKLNNGAIPFVVANFFDCNPAATAADFTGATPGNPAGPTIHWGDGAMSPGGTITANGTSANGACPAGVQANFTLSAQANTHIYSLDGVYNLQIDVSDVDGNKITLGNAGTVTIAPGIIKQLPPTSFNYPNLITPATGPVFLFEDSNPGALATDFPNTTIDWGDGSPTTSGSLTSTGLATCKVNVNPPPNQCTTFTVSGTHVYGFLGNFTVTVTLGGAGAGQKFTTTISVATISAAPFTALISPPQSQVKAGFSVDLLLTLSPTAPGGYPSPVDLGCTGLGTGMTCTFSPSATVPDVKQVRQIHVLVTTTATAARQSAPPLQRGHGPVQLALLLPGFVGAFGLLLMAPRARKDKRKTILWWAAGLLLLALLLAGCGGGPAQVTTTSSAFATQPGTYQVTVTMNAAGVTNPIATIQVVQ